MKNLFIALVAMAIGVFTVPVMATELSVSELMASYNDGTLIDYLVLVVVQKIADNPALSLFLMGLSASMPLIGFIANRTKNPIDNALMIFLNKVLQTLAFNTSKNQPDVLSWKQMLTHKPKHWSGLIVDTVVDEANDLKKRVLSKYL